VYAVDLHNHTRFFHGFEGRSTAFDPIGARLLTAVAGRRGMDAVALTNHDYRFMPSRMGPATPALSERSMTGEQSTAGTPTSGDQSGTGAQRASRASADDASIESEGAPESDAATPTVTESPSSTTGADGVEVARRSPPVSPGAAGPNPLAIPGIEITTTKGHLLVVGPDPPARTEPGTLTPDEAIELAHDRNCAAIIPHPFRASTVRETDATVDAVEVNGKHTHHRERVTLLAEERDCAIVGGSDAHYPFEVARAYTRVEAEELTPESVVAAIRDGRVEPAVRKYPLDRVLTPAYRVIHRLRGKLPAEDAQSGS